MKYTLRPYQKKFIHEIHDDFCNGFNAVLGQGPTGMGKTVVFSCISDGAVRVSNRVLILVHRQELICQTSLALSRFGIYHNTVAPGNVVKNSATLQYRELGRHFYDSSSLCTVGSVQTIGRKLEQFTNAYDFIITDECFVGDTLVNTKNGLKKIKDIKIGDLVYSFNGNNIELKKVEKVIKKPIYENLCEVYICGKKIICTENHLFFTKKGWTKAKNLNKNSMVLNITQEIKENEMFNLWCENRKSDEISKIQIKKRRQSLLFSRMRKRICQKNIINYNGRNKSQICFRPHEEKQSDEKSFNSRKSFSKIESYRTQAKNKGRKRSIYNSSITISYGSWLGNGISCKNAWERGVSGILQNRYCQSGIENRYRSRWRKPLCFNSSARRRKKDGLFNFARVEYSKVQKRGNYEQFERLYRQGCVYDLTVADNHNYFVNGFLVHNCHHAVAGQWRQITDANPKAKLLGLTATPERLDGKGLGVNAGGVYETMVLGPSVKELIKGGYLSAPRVFAPPVGFDDTGLKSVAGDYDLKEMALRLDKPKIIGNAVKHYSKLCEGMPAIAFCATVEHAQHTAEEFRKAGYNFKCIDGTMDDCDRRDAIEGLGNGKYDGLTSCEIISEGTDIPVVGCAIFLRKTKSLAKYLQQAGRVLRPYPGKEYSIILDHVGNVELHGFPDDDREWSLDGRVKKSKQTDEFFMRTCPNCYACYKSSLKACPVCGCEQSIKSKQEIEYVEAELVERERAAAKEQAESERRSANKFQQLVELGKRRGYQNPYAWAKHVFNARMKRKK